LKYSESSRASPPPFLPSRPLRVTSQFAFTCHCYPHARMFLPLLVPPPPVIQVPRRPLFTARVYVVPSPHLPSFSSRLLPSLSGQAFSSALSSPPPPSSRQICPSFPPTLQSGSLGFVGLCMTWTHSVSLLSSPSVH